jgi:hypothetical protein
VPDPCRPLAQIRTCDGIRLLPWIRDGSFRDSAGKGLSISAQWKNVGLPTIYVIDQTGRIRNRWVRAPSEETLSSAIDRLLTAAR